MAAQISDKKALELHIKCRACEKEFKWFLASGHKDLTITCPLCSTFALAIVEDFNIRLRTSPLQRPGCSTEKKRKYRI